MKRLSPKWINRLIVGLLLLGPLLVFVLGLCLSLAGAHGTFDPSADASFYLSDGVGTWIKSLWLTDLGKGCVLSVNTISGFRPLATFIAYLDTNMLHFVNDSYSYSVWGCLLYGYVYWCFHVILIDLACYAVLFIPRLIFRVLNKLEGDY